MRKTLLFAICCGMLMACEKRVVINADNFPDANFRAAVCFIIDAKEGDGIPLERFGEVKQLYLNNFWIKSLKGVEYFTALEELFCSDNLLTEIDVSKNIALKKLECGHNMLTSIDLSKNTQLVSLGCSYNQLTSIDVSANSELEILLCNGNKLDSIDVSHNAKLRELGVNECGLKSLDISQNTELEKVFCNNNHFKKLDLRNNTKLKDLFCNQPFIGHIDILRPADNPDLGMGSTHMWDDGLTFISWGHSADHTLELRDNIKLIHPEEEETVPTSNDSVNFEIAMSAIDKMISEVSKIQIRQASDTLKFVQLQELWESEENGYLPYYKKENLTHSQRVHALKSMLKAFDEFLRIAQEMQAVSLLSEDIDSIDFKELNEMRELFRQELDKELR